MRNPLVFVNGVMEMETQLDLLKQNPYSCCLLQAGLMNEVPVWFSPSSLPQALGE